MAILLTSALVDQLRAFADTAAPDECCGLLVSDAESGMWAVPARNVADRPDRLFEIDPAALIDAYRAERAGGPAVVGFYHSHPDGPAEPSATDAAMAAPDGKLWLIVGQGGTITVWRAVEAGARHGRFDAVPFTITD